MNIVAVAASRCCLGASGRGEGCGEREIGRRGKLRLPQQSFGKQEATQKARISGFRGKFRFKGDSYERTNSRSTSSVPVAHD